MKALGAIGLLGRALALLAALGLLAPPSVPGSAAAAPTSLLALAICTGDGIRIVRVPAGQAPPGEAPEGGGSHHQHCVLCLATATGKPLLPPLGTDLRRARQALRWRPPSRGGDRPSRRLFLRPPSRAPPSSTTHRESGE